MRVVTDTNTAVSGLLWYGAPRQVLDLARAGRIALFTSPVLLAELEDVLLREKFFRRVSVVGSTPGDLVWQYAALVTIIKPAELDPIILDDPDDDAVLACAISAHAEVIVSGDRHILSLKGYQNINILSAAEFVIRFLE